MANFGRVYEEFESGQVFRHWPGRTISEADDTWFSLLTMNQHPLHIDAHYASQTQHGQRLVVGTLVFSIVVGLSVADISGRAIANLEYEEIKHIAPVFHGDTIYAETTVLDKRESQSKPDRGIVTIATRGFQPEGRNSTDLAAARADPQERPAGVMKDLPLDGLRILAFEQFGAGPFATLNLADMGAEVIKIEDPTTGGEVSRFVPPYRGEADSIYFQSWNRNKKSFTLNLRKAEARDVLIGLVRVSDVVFNNLRSDQPAKLGLTYAQLGPVNPKIVCCSLSGFGSQSPRAKEPGYDYLMQASTGYMSVTGDPSSPPTACGVSFIDHAAGFAAALGMVSAVLAARANGIGRDVEVSLADTSLSMLTYLAAWTMNRGFEPQRYPGSAHQTLVPVQTFQTSDGYLTIFCGKEKFWRELCDCFGDRLLAERFAAFESRLEHRDEVVKAVQAHFLKRPNAEWLELLMGKVPCSPVRSMPEALESATCEGLGAVIDVEHPEWGTLREVNTPARFSGTARRNHSAAPALGTHTIPILREYLGYEDSGIAELRRQGAI